MSQQPREIILPRRDIFGECLAARGCNCRAFTEMVCTFVSDSLASQCANCPHTSDFHDLVGTRRSNGALFWYPKVDRGEVTDTARVAAPPPPTSTPTPRASAATVLQNSEQLAYGNRNSSTSAKKEESRKVFASKSAKELVAQPSRIIEWFVFANLKINSKQVR